MRFHRHNIHQTCVYQHIRISQTVKTLGRKSMNALKDSAYVVWSVDIENAPSMGEVLFACHKSVNVMARTDTSIFISLLRCFKHHLLEGQIW